MLGQRSGRIILGNPEAGNATVIRMLQQPKGGAGYCDSLDILLITMELGPIHSWGCDPLINSD